MPRKRSGEVGGAGPGLPGVSLCYEGAGNVGAGGPASGPGPDAAEEFERIVAIAERHRLSSFSVGSFSGQFHPAAFVPAEIRPPSGPTPPRDPSEPTDDEKLLMMSAG